MTFKLYGVSASPFVRKTRAFFLEKGVDYEVENVMPGMVPEGYTDKHPLGKVPCLEHDGRYVPDSSVIAQYLERVQPEPALYPSDPADLARALWLEEYADTALVNAGIPAFQERFIKVKMMGGQADEAKCAEVENELMPPVNDYLEAQLGDQQYLVGGRLSIADIAVASPYVNFAYGGIEVDAGRWPRLAAYLERMHSRPSFKGLIEAEKAEYNI